MSDIGYIKLRRGILDHLKSGRITSDEFSAYTVIILKANHRTGTWKGSGVALSTIVRWLPRKARRVLNSLTAKGYITTRFISGRLGNYPIKIERYFIGQKEPVNTTLMSQNKPHKHPFSGQKEPSIQEVKKEELLQEGEAAAKTAAFELPEWVPKEAWNNYQEMRRTIKKRMTPRAKEMAVTKLAELHVRGYMPKDVLDQSTFNCWQNLYPIKEENHGNRHSEDPNEKLRRAARNIGYDPKMAN